ncbi:MAG: dioxygenase extradiol [Pseudomonadota bacterium]
MTVITDNPARASFVALGQVLPRPSAILCISAHYETAGATHITGQPLPPTIHDFRGFPPELFAMRYPAPGSAGLVSRVLELWRQAAGRPLDWALGFGQRIVDAVLADDRAALTGFAPDDEAAALAVNSAEHYLPLLYAVGARLPGDGAAVFNDTLDGALAMASFLIGDVEIVARMEGRTG